ncbi:MAG: OmpA family protein [Phycisphaeraceae bacterium]
MTRMSTKVALLGLALLTAGGCISQGQYDSLALKERKSQEQIIDLKEQIASKQAEIDALRAAGPATDPNQAALIAKLEADRIALQAALDAARDGLRGAADIQLAGPLPAALDQALMQLAANNPELMEYDSRRGMVKLRSDLTFALGSTEINANGQSALVKLAGIINSEIASRYGVRIVGHTDNVPVTNATNVRRFGDNWGLSAFRAIAVKEIFTKSQVSPSRLEIAGRGEFQPIVANGPKGSEGNRRVEIFLFPMAGAGPVASGPEVAPIPVNPAKAGEDPAQFK